MKESQQRCATYLGRCFSSVSPKPQPALVILEQILILGLGCTISLLLAPEYTQSTYDGTKGSLVKVLTITAPIIGLLGGLTTPLDLSIHLAFLTKTLGSILFLALLVLAFDTSSTAFITVITLLVSFLFFAMLRDIRSFVMNHSGQPMASTISVLLVFLMPGLTGLYLITQILLNDDPSESAFMGGFALSETCLIVFFVYLWYKTHKAAFREFLPQVVVIASELEIKDARLKYKSLYVNNPICVRFQENSHLVLSYSMLLVVAAIEIYLSYVLYTNWNDTHACYLAISLKICIPSFLFFGYLYSSSSLNKDEKVALALLGAFPLFLVSSLLGNTLAPGENTKKLGEIVRYGIPGTVGYWICMIYLYRHNKRCYQLLTPVLCFALFIPFFVIYPLYEKDLVTVSAFAIIMGTGQVLGLSLFIVFWLGEVCSTLWSHLHLLCWRLKYLLYYDIVQCFYGFAWFGLSLYYAIVWADSDTENSTQVGILYVLIILYMALICSLTLQLLSLYPKEGKLHNFSELLVGNIERDDAQITLNKKKRVFQSSLLIAIFVEVVVVILLMIFSANSIYTQWLVLFPLLTCILLQALTIVGLKIKYFLMNLGDRWISRGLALIWFLFILPLAGGAPILLLYEASTNTVVLLISCSIFLTVLLFVSGGTLALNSLFLSLENEKFLKYCTTHVLNYCRSMAVNISDELVRSLIAQYKTLGVEQLSALMKSNSYVSEHILEDDEVFNKEILPARTSNRKETKRLSRKLSIKKREDVEGEVGCMETLFATCFKTKSETEESPLKEISIIDEDEPNEQPDSHSDEPELFPEKEVEALEKFDSSPSKADIIENGEWEPMREQYQELITHSEKVKQEWLEYVFKIFARGDYFSSHPYLNQYDLREFIAMADLKKYTPNHRSDLIYVKLTTKFSPGKTEKTFQKIDFNNFYYNLLPELALHTYPGKPTNTRTSVLISQKIFPMLTERIPELRKVVVELANIPEEELPDQRNLNLSAPEIIEIVAMAPEASSRNSVQAKFETIREETPMNSFRSSKGFIPHKPSTCKLCCSSCWESFKGFFKITPTPVIESEEIENEKLSQSPSWEELCIEIPHILDTSTTKWAQDQHLYGISSVKCTFANLVGILSHALEIVSYCLVGFSPEIQWLDWLYSLESANSKGVQQEGVWLSSYLTALGLVLIFVIIVLPVKTLTQKGRLGLNKDFTEAHFPSLQFFLVKLFTLLSTTLYLFVIKSMLSVFSCKQEGTDWILVSDDSQQCYEGLYWVYLLLGILAFFVYYPSATVLYPIAMYQNRSLDLKFDSSFLIVECQGKLLIAGTLAFFYESEFVIVNLAMTGAVCLGLLVYSYKISPCLIEKYNLWKTWAYTIPIWTMICAGLNYYSGYQMISFFLLVGGFGGILLSLSIVACFYTGKKTKEIADSTAYIQPSIRALDQGELYK